VDKELPKVTKSKTETASPRTIPSEPKTERLLPRRKKLRRLIELPKWQKLNTEQPSDIRANDRMDTEEPNWM
jgi:hypothetical protein